MPLVLREQNGLTGLVIICDKCHKILEEPDGLLLWNPDIEYKTENKKVKFYNPIITCYNCEPYFDKAAENSKMYLHSQEFDVAFFYLINNLKTDLEYAKKKAMMLALI